MCVRRTKGKFETRRASEDRTTTAAPTTDNAKQNKIGQYIKKNNLSFARWKSSVQVFREAISLLAISSSPISKQNRFKDQDTNECWTQLSWGIITKLSTKDRDRNKLNRKIEIWRKIKVRIEVDFQVVRKSKRELQKTESNSCKVKKKSQD